jgi:hypothetical protein
MKGQLTWTRLPQDFKNSPTILGEALARDLENCRPKDCTILQYVADILLVASTPQACKTWTEELLQLLREAGYKAILKKAQICQEEVIYLWYHLSQSKRRLGTRRKEVILQYPCPESQRQLREFLGAAGFCHLWIPGFSATASPLYEALKGDPTGPLHWGPEQEDAFQKLKRHLGEAPALVLPDVTCPFHL